MTDINIEKGDDKSWTVTIYDNTDVVVDLSSAEIYFYAKENEEDGETVIEKANTAGGGGDDEIEFVTDGTDGKIYLHIDSSDTSSIDYTDLRYEIKCVIAGNTMTVRNTSGILKITDWC